MFGRDDDNSQQQQGQQMADPSVLNAAMPDPITPTPPAGFNIPANGGSDSPAESSSAPELPSSDEPDTTPPSTSSNHDSDSPVTGGDDLVGIKQQALQHLSPLVSHLDQTPEEKFRTTMMMIQASDNKDLIKDAFEAAQKITDDKARAQALLDVINEINYFTQHETE